MPAFRQSFARERVPISFAMEIASGVPGVIESKQAQRPIRPVRLWVNPTTAILFEFVSIAVGIENQLIEIPTPCHTFMHNPDGLPFEMRICETANRIAMHVRNRDPQGGRVDLFEAVLWCDVFQYA